MGQPLDQGLTEWMRVEYHSSASLRHKSSLLGMRVSGVVQHTNQGREAALQDNAALQRPLRIADANLAHEAFCHYERTFRLRPAILHVSLWVDFRSPPTFSVRSIVLQS
jgi:hypothetical protein